MAIIVQSAIEHIVTRTTQQSVLASVAAYQVVAGSATEHIIGCAADCDFDVALTQVERHTLLA